MVSSADISKKNFLVIVFLFNSNIDCPYKSSRFYIVNQRRIPTTPMVFPYFQKSALRKKESGDKQFAYHLII